ncbi:MAG: AAA family ATPase, partial [Saprospiraceae bacterium]
MSKRLPLGLQDFRGIIEGGYKYIDKTEYIHRITIGGKYHFLSRPRRFGKSITISTLQELYSGSKELFKGLWIED